MPPMPRGSPAYSRRCAPPLNRARFICSPRTYSSAARRWAGGERTFTVGDLFAVAPQGLPTTPQYIALGHVHRPQAVSAAGAPARYAGSLLQLDFGEREQQKSVALVEVDAGRPAKVTEIPLNCGSRLLDVAGTLEELREMNVDPDAYVRVILRCEGPAPGLAELVREIIPRALDVRLEYEREEARREPGDTRRLEPRDLFAQYYRSRYGAEAGETLMKLFNELFEEVTGAPA
jgi:exonuclease SbcD